MLEAGTRALPAYRRIRGEWRRTRHGPFRHPAQPTTTATLYFFTFLPFYLLTYAAQEREQGDEQEHQHGDIEALAGMAPAPAGAARVVRA